GILDGYMKLTVKTPSKQRSIAGAVFSDGKPRFIQIKGITIDAEIGAHMLYTTNRDVPGIIGALGATMGAHGVNIANFTLGRTEASGDAIALLYVDAPVSEPVLKDLRESELFQMVAPLEFDV
ncbi:MAG TPA: ACT domain-containing protein, partial [Rhodobacterales bacterium]|nr:ACT domain-containing protein [Rhodobacterales bacterium]